MSHLEGIRAALGRSATIATYAHPENMARGKAESTAVTISRAVRLFVAWCRVECRTAIPATSETLAAYTAYLVQDITALPGTVRLQLACVRAWHRDHAEPVPDGVPAWFVLRVHERSRAAAGYVDETTDALTFGELRLLFDACDRSSAAGERDAAALMVLWSMMLTGPRLIAANLRDVEVGPDGLRMRVPRIGGELADDDVEGDVAFRVHHFRQDTAMADATCPGMCPVETISAWVRRLEDAGAVGGPLIRVVDKFGNIGGVHRAAGRKADPQGRWARARPRDWFAALCARAGLDREGRRLTLASVRLGGLLDVYAREENYRSVAGRARVATTTVFKHVEEAGLM